MFTSANVYARYKSSICTVAPCTCNESCNKIVTDLREKNYVARRDEEGERKKRVEKGNEKCTWVTTSPLLIILSREESELRFAVKADFRIDSPVRSTGCDKIFLPWRRRGFKCVWTTRRDVACVARASATAIKLRRNVVATCLF